MSRLLNNFFGWFFKVENPPMVNYIKTEYPEQDWEYQANKNGVEIIPLVCKWNYDEVTSKGTCEFVTDQLNVNLESE